ncbi:MAG TPA: hypothetical protein VEQ10_18285, partial [Vicinamibacteria bacterium]|nr:hypothetical protein [Vicinamibacteria bacterium]
MRAHRLAQWVASVEDASMPAELAGHYVFAGFEQQELGLTLRLEWVFSPRLTLQMYAQPLLSRGDYAGFKELLRPRSFEFLVYTRQQLAYDPLSATYTADPGRGEPFSFADPDFSYRSLRVNTVLRWEWRPGSALFAVWTQGRESSADPRQEGLGRNLDELFGSP